MLILYFLGVSSNSESFFITINKSMCLMRNFAFFQRFLENVEGLLLLVFYCYTAPLILVFKVRNNFYQLLLSDKKRYKIWNWKKILQPVNYFFFFFIENFTLRVTLLHELVILLQLTLYTVICMTKFRKSPNTYFFSKFSLNRLRMTRNVKHT